MFVWWMPNWNNEERGKIGQTREEGREGGGRGESERLETVKGRVHLTNSRARAQAAVSLLVRVFFLCVGLRGRQREREACKFSEEKLKGYKLTR